MSATISFIESKSGQQRILLEYLHQLLMEYPEVTTKIRYKIPFYYRKSWVCYLNPIKNDGIELAFTRANELSNEQGMLHFKSRKQIAGIEFFSIKEIEEAPLHEILQEAFLLDAEIPYKIKRK